MYKFVLGIAAGIYVGTYYDCKPMIEYTKKRIQEHIPKERNK